MTGRSTHSYWVKATDWHDLQGRGRGVVVRAPWDRHAVGDVVLV